MKYLLFFIITVLFHNCNPYIELSEHPEKLCSEYVTWDRLKVFGYYIGIAKDDLSKVNYKQISKTQIQIGDDLVLAENEGRIGRILVLDVVDSLNMYLFDREGIEEACGKAYSISPVIGSAFMNYSNKKYSFLMTTGPSGSEYLEGIRIGDWHSDQVRPFFDRPWYERWGILASETVGNMQSFLFRCHRIWGFNICRFSSDNDIIQNPQRLCNESFELSELNAGKVRLGSSVNELSEQIADKNDLGEYKLKSGIIIGTKKSIIYKVFIPAEVFEGRGFKTIQSMKRHCQLPDSVKIFDFFNFYYRDHRVLIQWHLPKKIGEPSIFRGIFYSIDPLYIPEKEN